jgi:hypothetical protein
VGSSPTSGFLVAACLVAALAAPASAAAARPVSGAVLLAIDKRAGFRNYLPTRMPSGFTYSSWSYRAGVLRVDFLDKAGSRVQWRVEPTSGACDVGKQASYQLDGNKVWWARNASGQRAWRCVFGQDGKPLRLVAASATPPTKLAPVGLGIVVASGKRY